MNQIPVNYLKALAKKWRSKGQAVRALEPIANLLGSQQSMLLMEGAEIYDQTAGDLEELINEQVEQPLSLTMKPAEEDADRLELTVWLEMTKTYGLVDDDGTGYWGNDNMVSNQQIRPSDMFKEVTIPEWADCVYWYNK